MYKFIPYLLLFLSANVYSEEFELALYYEYTDEVIKAIQYERIASKSDAEVHIKNLSSLVELTISSVDRYNTKNKEMKSFVEYVIANSYSWKDLSREQLQTQWLSGARPFQDGMVPELADHFCLRTNLMDIILHPVSAILILQEFQSSGDIYLLTEASDELIEAKNHIKELQK